MTFKLIKNVVMGVNIMVPNAKPGRESTKFGIYGMQGISVDILVAHYGEEEDDAPPKVARVDIPSTPLGEVPRSLGVAYPPQPAFRAVQPMYNPALLGPPNPWAIPPHPQPWYPHHVALSKPPMPSSTTHTLQPAQITPPGLPTSAPAIPLRSYSINDNGEPKSISKALPHLSLPLIINSNSLTSKFNINAIILLKLVNFGSWVPIGGLGWV
ncbi:hypothetical protein UlMin_000506 [Ulmus minor]